MEKSINLKIIETKEQIVNIVQACGLPGVITQMIFREIGLAIDIETKGIIEKEKNDYENSMKEVSKSDS